MNSKLPFSGDIFPNASTISSGKSVSTNKASFVSFLAILKINLKAPVKLLPEMLSNNMSGMHLKENSLSTHLPLPFPERFEQSAVTL